MDELSVIVLHKSQLTRRLVENRVAPAAEESVGYPKESATRPARIRVPTLHPVGLEVELSIDSSGPYGTRTPRVVRLWPSASSGWSTSTSRKPGRSASESVSDRSRWRPGRGGCDAHAKSSSGLAVAGDGHRPTALS